MNSAWFVAAGILLIGTGASILPAADLTGDWRGTQTCDCWDGMSQNKAINGGQWLFVQARPAPSSNVYSIDIAGDGIWTMQTVEGTKDPDLVQGVLFT